MSGLDMVSLFESESETVYEDIHLLPQDLTITVQKIDEYPGASQSGYHLWPGANQLTQYLCKNWSTLSTSRVCEMGCGCGLATLGVAALGAVDNSCEFMLATDGDQKILDKVLESAKYTTNETGTALLPIETCRMKWGEDLEQLQEMGYANTFNLVIGSDLIYSDGLIEPLLQTVFQLLNKDDENACFLLCYSFTGYVEEAVKVSEDMNLNLEILMDTIQDGGYSAQSTGTRIERYTRR
jgi:predicted nicotinamide N-methyase